MVKINSNGNFCELRSDVMGKKWNDDNLPQWDRKTFAVGDKIMAEEDWSLWNASIDGEWKEMF